MNPALSDKPRYEERLDPAERHDIEGLMHWVRYEWASRFLPAQRVLDCACGLGYGSALLAARGAGEVVGVDISPAAIETATRRYPARNVHYRVADALGLSRPEYGTFALIACFETIEHVAHPERLLDALANLVAPDGVLLLSCPNDAAFGAKNPFHLWIADQPTVRSWLQARFAHVAEYVQVQTIGSGIWPRADAERTPDPDRLSDASVRTVDHVPVDAVAGFVFACGATPRAPCSPVAVEMLDGLRHREALWQELQATGAEARRLAHAWQLQTARVAELEQAKNDLWEEAQRLGKAWQAQTTRVAELEQSRDQLRQEIQTTATEARRLAEAWERQAARLREVAAARQELEAWLEEWQRQPLIRLLQRLGLLRRLTLLDGHAGAAHQKGTSDAT